MLKNVHIKNLALIREAEIDLEDGLNIMTGETGAGKSIIINSISMALGDKANRSFIRAGADHSLVELLFVTTDEEILSILDELGISRDGSNISVMRRISPDSSLARVNGENVTLASLKRLTGRLVDIYGQHDHQSLLDPSAHIDILDMFGGKSLANVRAELKKEYDEYSRLRREASGFTMDREELERRKSLLEFQKNEIEKAAVTGGEDTRLEAEYRRLASYEKAADSLSKALSSLESGAGAKAYISNALNEVSYARTLIADDDSSNIDAIINTLKDLESISQDVFRDLEKYTSSHSFDRERFETVRARLELINRLKDKYGKTADDINAYGDKCAEELKSFENYEQNKKILSEKMAASKMRLNTLAAQLSAERHRAADVLAPCISDNLRELNFLNSEFVINLENTGRISSNGFDRAEFLISANPGEKPAPLARTASGGELSRIMLAIKSAMAGKDNMPTLIFDEIDTGISGFTAQKVARKLALLSNDHQLMCITHLPQIAAMADTHFAIHKETGEEGTITGTEKLDDRGQILEIARLISADSVTQTGLKNAAELKENADAFKSSFRGTL